MFAQNSAVFASPTPQVDKALLVALHRNPIRTKTTPMEGNYRLEGEERLPELTTRVQNTVVFFVLFFADLSTQMRMVAQTTQRSKSGILKATSDFQN